MTDVWEDRKKALENEFFRKKDSEAVKKMQQASVKEICAGRCPKCGKNLEPTVFHDVPLDQCPGCGGVWLGPNDFKTLSQKDHRSWFDRWFQKNDKNSI